MGQATMGNLDELRARLNLMQLQMQWLQQEMMALRKALDAESSQSERPRTFASLYGVWSSARITDQDLEDARIKVSEELL